MLSLRYANAIFILLHWQSAFVNGRSEWLRTPLNEASANGTNEVAEIESASNGTTEPQTVTIQLPTTPSPVTPEPPKQTQKKTVNEPVQKIIPLFQQENDLFDGDIAGVAYTGEENKFGIQYQINSWPDGIVPYTLDPSYSDREISVINDSMRTIARDTCIHFVPRTNEPFYLRITNTGNGCYSYVGNRQVVGGQILSLESSYEKSCIDKLVVTHELLHALGLWHEHGRQRRDEYLLINYDQIVPSKVLFFVALNERFDPFSKLPYDSGSIMHYPLKAWATPNKLSMIASNTLTMNWIGNSRFPSADDLYKIKRLYKCFDHEDAPVVSDGNKHSSD